MEVVVDIGCADIDWYGLGEKGIGELLTDVVSDVVVLHSDDVVKAPATNSIPSTSTSIHRHRLSRRIHREAGSDVLPAFFLAHAL